VCARALSLFVLGPCRWLSGCWLLLSGSSPCPLLLCRLAGSALWFWSRSPPLAQTIDSTLAFVAHLCRLLALLDGLTRRGYGLDLFCHTASLLNLAVAMSSLTRVTPPDRDCPYHHHGAPGIATRLKKANIRRVLCFIGILLELFVGITENPLPRLPLFSLSD
jgi:hypothetical protein